MKNIVSAPSIKSLKNKLNKLFADESFPGLRSPLDSESRASLHGRPTLVTYITQNPSHSQTVWLLCIYMSAMATIEKI